MHLDITPESLRKWRKENGMTQADLGRLIGLDNITIAKIETGKRGISPAEAKLLAMHLFPASSTQMEFSDKEWQDITAMANREGFTSPTQWVVTKIRVYLAMTQAAPVTHYAPQEDKPSQKVAEAQKPYGSE